MTSHTHRQSVQTVVTDTNVLINFMHGRHLGLLGRVRAHRFAIPGQVKREVTWPEQVAALDAALCAGLITTCDMKGIDADKLYRDLLEQIEEGEAACIAIAATEGHAVATDERREARRIAIQLLGAQRLLRTEDIIDRCIEGGLLSIAEADDFKRVLESKRYKMRFASFAERAVA